MMNIEQAIDEFLLDCEAGERSPETIRWYRSLLGAFSRVFPGQSIDTFTASHLREYKAALRARKQLYAASNREIEGGYSIHTRQAHDRALRAFWNWAACEFDIDNPMQNVKRPARAAPKPRAAKELDFIKLFNACGEDAAGDRDRAMLVTLAETGCRRSGLVSMRISDLNPVQRSGLVVEKGKGPRRVFWHRSGWQFLQKWLDVRIAKSDYIFTNLATGEPLTVHGVSQRIKVIKNRAGVKGAVNPHAFRHAFAVSYLLNGGDIATLAKLLGHSIQVAFDYYAVFTEDELRLLHRKFGNDWTDAKKL